MDRKMPTKRARWSDWVTLREFSALLSYVIQGSPPRILSPEETANVWNGKKPQKGNKKIRAMWDQSNNLVVAYLFPDGDMDQPPSTAAVTEPFVEPDALDIQFLDRLVRVFNDDVRHAPSMLLDDELWASLRQTQFRRAITKYSAFKKVGMLQWLQALETGTRLRYEGHAFTLSVLMTYHLEYVVDNLSTAYVPFRTPMTFSDAILGEKWIRAVTRSERVGLVGLSSGRIIGFFVIPPAAVVVEERWRFAPHFDLRGVQQLVREGTCAFVTSAAGDVRVILPNGTTFLNSQGQWRYSRYESIIPVLVQHMREELAVSLLRSALDLSFERHGALLCVAFSDEYLSIMIPDFVDPKTNRHLRQSVRGLSLLSWYQREVIVSAAGTDGAVVLDLQGMVRDAACIVADPPTERVKQFGFEKPYRGSGARETAAWNASLYGIAVKISADGPITFYLHGKVIAGLG